MKGSLQANAFYLMANSFGTTALGFVFWIVVGRYYGVTEVGIASTIVAAATFMSLLSTLGFDYAVIRYLAKSKKRKTHRIINSCFTVSLILSLIMSVFFLFLVIIWIEDIDELVSNFNYMVLFILFVIAGTLSPIMNSVLISRKKSKFVLFRDVGIFSTLKIVFAFILVSYGALGIILSWTLGAVLSLLIGIALFLPISVKGWRPRLKVHGRTMRSMMSFSGANYLGNLFYISPSLILPIIITMTISADVTAYFRISWMVASVLYIIPVATTLSLFAEGSSNSRTLVSDIRKTFGIIFALLTPALIILYVFGGDILNLIGTEYSENGLDALKIFALASIPLSFNTIAVTLKRIEKDSRAIMLIYGIMAATYLSLSIFVMEEHGLVGIAYSWLISQMAVSIFVGFWMLKLDLIKKKTIAPAS